LVDLESANADTANKDHLDVYGGAGSDGNDYLPGYLGKKAFDPFSDADSRSNISPYLTMVAVYNIRSGTSDTMLMDFFVGGSQLTATSYRLNDATGNNNGIAEEGETVGLTVTLANTTGWYNASGISAVLATTDTSVIVTKATATFPNINNGSSASCAGDSFAFYVKPGIFPHKVQFLISKTANPESYDKIDTLSVPVGFPRVLLVDDDAGAAYESYYTGSLDTVGALYRSWTTATQGSPALALMDSFPVVIWFTGDDSLNTLAAEDTTNLKSYLDGGGNLFLCSRQLGQQLGATGFYHDYLRANYVNNNANQRILRGVNGNPVSLSLADTIALGYSGGSLNYQSMDVIQPLSGADSCFVYRNSSNVGGIIFDGYYKLVYLAFPFEAVGGPDRYLSRNELMGRILSWFGGVLPSGVEAPYSGPLPNGGERFRLQAAPSPFRSETAFYFNLTHGTMVWLTVYNYLGQRVAGVHQGVLPRGSHRLSWNGRGEDGSAIAPGVYFARLEVAGQGR